MLKILSMEDILFEIRYPIGRYARVETNDIEAHDSWISAIDILPRFLDACIENLDAAQLQTPYRPGGWTAQQVIHHIADSHMNAYIRMKLALTEEAPVINPYDENLWAVMPDVESVPVNISITLVHALHRRWVAVLRSLTPEQWNRSYYHPEQKAFVALWQMTHLYAWHGRHHVEQIMHLRRRMNW
jgi:hypothetical protein